MTTLIDRLFSASDRERIEAAVKEAELRTSGEIVPYVVERCDDYEEAEWRGTLLLSLAGFVAVTVVRAGFNEWLPVDVTGITLVTLGCALAGFSLVRFIPAVKRRLAGRGLLHRRVSQRAAEAFLAEEVFATRERTGILLFASMLERTAIVMGDSGINARVRPEDWQDIVRLLTSEISRGRPADGFVAAIGASGTLLEREGVARRADDRDELSDSLRTGAR
jgi:putative membrane protein